MATCCVCESPAKLWCENDKAFLCAECDHKVHSSNALAARHSRFPICELCKSSACQVYCCQDKAYLCDVCDAAVHSDNVLAARHMVVPAAQALAGQVQNAIVESDAQSEAAGKPAQQAQAQPECQQEHESSPPCTGSEAVVPVFDVLEAEGSGMSDQADKAAWGKEFDLLDLDNGWPDCLDVGFDFSDILGQDAGPTCDAGLVPTFDGPMESMEDVSELGMVPVLEDLGNACSSPTSSSLNLDLSLPALFDVPFSGPPPAASLAPPSPQQLPPVQHAQQPAPVWHTTFPALQASPYFPNPASFPAVSKEQALANREQRVARYREKRKHRKFEKTIRYASRKAYAEVRPRIKGRFARKDEIESWARDGVIPEGVTF